MIFSAGAMLAAGYVGACYLTGENLIATWWDEWRLSRRSLAELDAACAANMRSSGLVVSLTTIPSRIVALELTIKSLLRQSCRPTEIRLCLPAWSTREQRLYEVPAWLAQLRCVKIVRCEDKGPATKFLPTLQEVAPDQAVLIVDDDRIYHARLLERYVSLTAANPHEVVSGAGWNVPADLIDRPTTLSGRLRRAPHVPVRANQLGRVREVDIVQGVHSYVVRPRFFDLKELGDFTAAPDSVRRVDDVWVSAHCQVPKRVHPMRLGYTDFLPWRNRKLQATTSLGRLNRAENPEQRSNSIALKYLSDRWRKRGEGTLNRG
ncbi:hypothetical protein [Rariglobus hedericola]|uniref:Glycosyltransferase family 2 protein n=1 Tax=Rariglobus hedericola TaxID=2597822 RepID=A0A556QQV5_9BACT|nr:hypothetical protein [Rariglobus hedericola]TSJ79024.1 hypothetical protein FPL22_06915 [Rariglobus hedericola]